MKERVDKFLLNNNLQDEKTSGKEHQNKGKKRQKQQSPEAAYSFHVLPPIRPILQIRE